MFGLNEITWPEFLKVVLTGLIAWYGLLFILGWIRSKQKDGQVNYEEYQSGIAPDETLQPIVVSAQDYPSEILPVNLAGCEPLNASLYEETGYDGGLALEQFIIPNNPVLAKMMTEIHHQQ